MTAPMKPRKPPKKDFVVLADNTTHMKIVGELIMDERECVVEGVIEGMSLRDLYVRPAALHGTSSAHGSVWIDQLATFSPCISSNTSTPATVRLVATSVYYGRFDPRAQDIDSLTCSLDHVHRLTDDLPIERKVSPDDRRLTSTDLLDVHRCEVLAAPPLRIAIEYRPSVSEHVTYKQVLVVEFDQPTSLTNATAAMDRALVLLSLFAGGIIESPYRSINATDEYATEWKSRARTEDVSNPSHWLERPERCVKLLRKLLPKWHQIDDNELHMARIFLGAAHENVYLENRFLAYCQTFEHLNMRRAPQLRMDEADYAAAVMEPLESSIEALNIKKGLKDRIRRSILDGNRPSLEGRLTHAFSTKPGWLLQLGDKTVIKFRSSVCKRRNALSHGSPSGTVRDRTSAINTQIDTHFIFLYCLSELLNRCGIDEMEVSSLVVASEDFSTLSWLAPQSQADDVAD